MLQHQQRGDESYERHRQVGANVEHGKSWYIFPQFKLGRIGVGIQFATTKQNVKGLIYIMHIFINFLRFCVFAIFFIAYLGC